MWFTVNKTSHRVQAVNISLNLTTRHLYFAVYNVRITVARSVLARQLSVCRICTMIERVAVAEKRAHASTEVPFEHNKSYWMSTQWLECSRRREIMYFLVHGVFSDSSQWFEPAQTSTRLATIFMLGDVTCACWYITLFEAAPVSAGPLYGQLDYFCFFYHLDWYFYNIVQHPSHPN